jgi:hypothetical protein
MMKGCGKCRKVGAVLFLVLGALFLARDLGYWSFWGVQWYSALFLLVGVVHLAQCQCKDCCAVMEGKRK